MCKSQSNTNDSQVNSKKQTALVSSSSAQKATSTIYAGYPQVWLKLSHQIKILMSTQIKNRLLIFRGKFYFQGSQQIKLQRPYLNYFIEMIQIASQFNRAFSFYQYTIQNQEINYISKVRIIKCDVSLQTVKKISLNCLKELRSTLKLIVDIFQILGICKIKNYKIISLRNKYLDSVRKIFNNPQYKNQKKVYEQQVQPNDQKKKQTKVHDILQLQDFGSTKNQDQVKKGGYFLIQKRNLRIVTELNRQLKDIKQQIFAAKIFNPKQKHKKSMTVQEMKQIQMQKIDNQLNIVKIIGNSQYLINYYKITPETIIKTRQQSCRQSQKIVEQFREFRQNVIEYENIEVQKKDNQISQSPLTFGKLAELKLKEANEQKSRQDEFYKAKTENLGVCIYMQHFQYSLSDYIYYNDFMSIEESIALCIEIVKAVITLSQSGVVHRDLKPSNILIDTSNPNKIGIRIIDFGQSCHFKDRIDNQKSKGSTIPYSPPQSQQNTERGRLSPNIDKWSVGIIIYQLLNKKLPVTYSKAFLGDIQFTWPSQFLMPIDISEKHGIKAIKNVLNFLAIRMIKVNPDDRAGLNIALLVLEQTKNYVKQLKLLQSIGQYFRGPEAQNKDDDANYQYLRQLAMKSPQIALHLQKNMEIETQNSDMQSQMIRCQEKGFLLGHQKHFSQRQHINHYQDQCPVINSKENQCDSPFIAENINPTCKADGCTQPHTNHYCRFCRMVDSDHISMNCLRAQRQIQKCGAIECSLNHAKHYCKACSEYDANHLARDCPQSITVYHGTTEDCARMIFNSRNLGIRIYFTPNKQAAQGIAKLRQENQKNGFKHKSVLIKAIIRKRKGHFIQRIHGPWAGAYPHNFSQIAVIDDKDLKIVKYQYIQ